MNKTHLLSLVLMVVGCGESPPSEEVARKQEEVARKQIDQEIAEGVLSPIGTNTEAKPVPWQTQIEYEEFGTRSVFERNSSHVLKLWVRIDLPDKEPVKKVSGQLWMLPNGQEIYSAPFTTSDKVSFSGRATELLTIEYDDNSARHRTLRHKTTEVKAKFRPTEVVYADGKIVKYSDTTLRSRWLNESYNQIIYHVQGNQWSQLDNKTQQPSLPLAHFTEIGRTAEYIELSGFNFGVGRIFPSRLEMKKGDKWEWVSNGHWITK